MFACKIFGSKGSSLTGEVCVLKAEVGSFFAPYNKEFSMLLSTGSASYSLGSIFWPFTPSSNPDPWLPLGAWFGTYRAVILCTVSPNPPLPKSVFPPHLLLCAFITVAHFHLLKILFSLSPRDNTALTLLCRFPTTLLSRSLAPPPCLLLKISIL